MHQNRKQIDFSMTILTICLYKLKEPKKKKWGSKSAKNNSDKDAI